MRLYDSATATVRPFEPLVPGEVGIYLCGVTVQSPPHIGHVRSALAFDVLARWLTRTGHRVRLIRNVTDIDDKILAKAQAGGEEWWALAARNGRALSAAYDALGVLPPAYEPHATAHIPSMLDLMARLVDRGHAYATPSGDVYFDVRSWPAYGGLTRQRIADMEVAETDAAGKRDPHDFALWKSAKPGEPPTATWNAPDGPGRPGWHLECSAMAHRYLGPEFDIHGGGLDLRFPHHENERAQSQAAGYGFARYWLHNGWVTQAGTKMSKSLGNGLLVSTVLASVPAPVLRLALTAVRYRSMLEWTPDTLRDAGVVWERLSGLVDRAPAVSLDDVAVAELPARFVAAMDDDLDIPAALAVVHDVLHEGNSALAGGDAALARDRVLALRAMLSVLGLDPGAWAQGSDDRTARALDALVEAELAARTQARARRDFAQADAIRDRLVAAGIAVEDSAGGSRWTLAGRS